MPKKIMVVDDENPIIVSVREGLKSLASKYDVVGAKSGYECIKKLEDEELPDLILLDIMMPGMDGWAVQRQIQSKADWKEIPIVFLTAKTEEHSKRLGNVVAKDYIEKPFEIIDLKNRIDKILK